MESKNYLFSVPSGRSRTRPLVINREFKAPVELVWKAWTEPEELKRWWGPKNFTAPFSRIDFQVGGRYLNCMRTPEGRDYWSTGVYLEIIPLKKIVFTDSFSDGNGNIVSAAYYGMEDNFPMELRVTLDFDEVGGKTRMTLKHEGVPSGGIKELTGTGWNESFDKLEFVLV